VHAFIAESFPEWAVLRPSWFMQNFAGRHPHADAILTGPAALSYDDVAGILSRASGREITHHDVGYERMGEAFEAGLPGEYARFLAGLDALIASEPRTASPMECSA
jgi:uncharacterized protein YbjT (DUF2867 family)